MADKAHKNMLREMLESFNNKIGTREPTEKEAAEAREKMEKRPTAAYGRKKQGAGGGFAIYE